MSVNAYRPHLMVLSEDKANSDIANGFVNNVNVAMRSVQVLPYVSGWEDVIKKFKCYHIQRMREFPQRRLLLLIDFDGEPESRFKSIESEIPDDIKERVFVLGVLTEPEKLRSGTKKKFEAIGATLAGECAESRNEFWMHEQLSHNQSELARLTLDVRPFLFP